MASRWVTILNQPNWWPYQDTNLGTNYLGTLATIISNRMFLIGYINLSIYTMWSKMKTFSSIKLANVRINILSVVCDKILWSWEQAGFVFALWHWEEIMIGIRVSIFCITVIIIIIFFFFIVIRDNQHRIIFLKLFFLSKPISIHIHKGLGNIRYFFLFCEN